jgi:hypothetical protein
MAALHFSGYELVAHRFVSESELYPDVCDPLELHRVDGDPSRYREHIKERFCVWSIFQLRGEHIVADRPTRFSLLFVCADGVDTFHRLYVAGARAPKVISIIQPGHGFGYNWTDFTNPDLVFARAVQANPAGKPEMILYGGSGVDRQFYSSPCWPSYGSLMRRFRKTGGGTVGVWTQNLRNIGLGKKVRPK